MTDTQFFGLLVVLGVLGAGFARNRWHVAATVIYLLATLFLLTMTQA